MSTSTESPPPVAGDVADAATSEAPAASKVRKSGGIFWLVILGATMTFTVIVLLGVARRGVGAPPLPVLTRIPTFTLTDQKSRAVGDAQLAGKVWIADFIFLGCQQSCPKLTGRMAGLQERLAARGAERGKPLPVKLVSFSVDPENDTPERLDAYATKWKAAPETWSFLTGKNVDLEKIVVDGFKMQYGKGEEGAGVFTIMHGDWFVLVDAKGRVRGYYESSEPAQLEKILADAERLAEDVRS